MGSRSLLKGTSINTCHMGGSLDGFCEKQPRGRPRGLAAASSARLHQPAVSLWLTRWRFPFSANGWWWWCRTKWWCPLAGCSAARMKRGGATWRTRSPLPPRPWWASMGTRTAPTPWACSTTTTRSGERILRKCTFKSQQYDGDWFSVFQARIKVISKTFEINICKHVWPGLLYLAISLPPLQLATHFPGFCREVNSLKYNRCC